MNKKMTLLMSILVLLSITTQVMAQSNETISEIRDSFIFPFLILGLVILCLLIAAHSFMTKNIAEIAVTFIVVIFIILFVTML